ncbi:MAG: carboxypeptidase-like regulatory domain-containing protein [Candidatus Bathyarchaeia archaeon]
MKKTTVVTTFMVILLAITFTFTTLLPHVRATNGVEITSITPTTHNGKVGDAVQIIGTINKTDGEYRIWFGSYNVTPTEPRATGNLVNATFQIPHVPNENYTITLQDIDKNINATALFYVETAYYIKAVTPSSPQQLQENDTVNILVNVTGGKPNIVYYANVSVMIPSPLRTNYSAIVELTNTTDTGDGFANIVYPNQTLFSGSNTNYTGLYRIYFNKTQNLAENSFFVGITDKSEYHREEVVQIKAVGYQPNQTANITVTFPNTNKTVSWQVNASQQGTINTTWPGNVPSNASIGDYNITISSGAPIKPVRDSQLFSIPGYQIEVYTRNLAGDAVPQILVEALDQATNIKNNDTSDENGIARFRLESGNHTFEPFWRGKVKVPEMQNVTITGNATYYLKCELTNMKITVKDTDENLIPFVYLNITYQYVTTKEGNVTKENMTGETDLSGLFFINSTLTHINYTINASRYEIVFNKNNNTIQDLPAKAWFNVTILCPPKTLTLNVTENHRNPLTNARVELIEQMGGIAYTKFSNDSGIAVINCTFGNYTLKVYKNNIFLNETFLEMFNDTYREIYCKLYNLTVSVKVVDYFGQPIPNANVTWQAYGLQNSTLTKSDGIATFSNVIGGDLRMMVYLPSQSQPFEVTTSFIDSSRTIEIKLDKYVVLAGFLVETSNLTTAMIIAATVLLVLLIEVYGRKRLKPQKSSS